MALLRRRQASAFGGLGGEQPTDDDAIVLRALVDRSAFAPLYERYVDAIYGRCYRRVGEREAAEDLTGLVFRKALEGLPGYHGGSFKAWLFTIADRVLIDAGRASRPFEPLDESENRFDPAPGPEELAVAAFDCEQLRRAMAQLPEEWRRVVELRLDGFGCDEVARIVGNRRTAEWVRQTHLRAKKTLRRILTEDQQPKGGAR